MPDMIKKTGLIKLCSEPLRYNPVKNKHRPTAKAKSSLPGLYSPLLAFKMMYVDLKETPIMIKNNPIISNSVIFLSTMPKINNTIPENNNNFEFITQIN